MSINATIDGTAYNGIETISVGGKTISLSAASAYDVFSFATEKHIQTWTPEEDFNGTNNTKTFPFGTNGTPDLWIITSEAENATALTFETGFAVRTVSYSGTSYYTTSCFTMASTNAYNSNGFTVTEDLEQKNITIKLPKYSDIGLVWKAGRTYRIISVVL